MEGLTTYLPGPALPGSHSVVYIGDGGLDTSARFPSAGLDAALWTGNGHEVFCLDLSGLSVACISPPEENVQLI
jgi:hypothetical protein